MSALLSSFNIGNLSISTCSRPRWRGTKAPSTSPEWSASASSNYLFSHMKPEIVVLGSRPAPRAQGMELRRCTGDAERSGNLLAGQAPCALRPRHALGWRQKFMTGEGLRESSIPEEVVKIDQVVADQNVLQQR